MEPGLGNDRVRDMVKGDVQTTSRRLLMGVLLGILVFAGFSLVADIDTLSNRLASFAWWTFLAALGLALVNYALRFVRWHFYLRYTQIPVPRGRSALVFVSGFALSVTPGKIGELVKSYLLRELEGVALTKSAPIVLAERVTDLLALVILCLFGVFFYGVAKITVAIGAAVLVIGLIILTVPPLSHFLIRGFTYLSILRRYRIRLYDFYDNLYLLIRPVPLLSATVIAMVAWCAECMGFALIANGFPGASVPIGLAILIYAATTVAGALSFLPGGLLVTEGTMTLLLVEASSGFDQSTAIAATMLIRLATLWFAVVLGVIALTTLQKRHRQVGFSIEPVDPRTEDPCGQMTRTNDDETITMKRSQ